MAERAIDIFDQYFVVGLVERNAGGKRLADGFIADRHIGQQNLAAILLARAAAHF